MGRKEEPLITYYNNNARFAELVNGWLFDGEAKLKAENISEADRRLVREIGMKMKRYWQRYRDLYKQIGNLTVHLFVGIELQERTDYTMPLRIMDMDTASYVEQKKQISAVHREKQDLKKGSREEFLSDFKKTDRLRPVITLVLYFGEAPWSGARSLHEMLDFEGIPEEIKEYVEDYRIHILDVHHTSDEELEKFPPDIRFMLLFIKYAKDEAALNNLETLCGQETVSEDTFQAIVNYVNEPKLLKWKKETGEGEKGAVNMCEGIRKLIENGRVEGAAQMVLGFLEELGTIPENVKERILAERDMEMLKKWSRLAARSASIDDFCGKMQ